MKRSKVLLRLSGLSFFCLLYAGLYAQDWGDFWQFGTSLKESSSVLITTPEGDILLGGQFQDQFTLGGTTVNSLGEEDVFLAKITESGETEWLISGGSFLEDNLTSVAIDESGNIYCTGTYWQEGDFGGIGIESSLNPKAIFLVKYDTEGNAIWAQSLDSGNLKNATDLAIDAEGNIYATGYFSGQLLVGEDTLAATGNSDLFLLKFDPNGNLLLKRRAGYLGDTRAMNIAIGPESSVYLSGFYNDTTIIGGTTLAANTFDRDVFIARLTDAGEGVWAQRAGGVFDDEVTGMAIHENGDLFLSGYLVGVMDLTETESIQSGNGNPDFYLLRYQPNGNLVFGRAYGGTLTEQTSDLLIAGDQVVISGFYLGNFDIDGITTTAGAGFSGFIAAFDLDGQAKWLRNIPAEGSAFPEAVQINSSGNLYTTGSFSGNIEVDGVTYSSNGSFDIFLAVTPGSITSVREGIFRETIFKINPNPSSGEIIVETDLAEFKLEVFDPSGRLLWSGKNKRTIDLSFLPNGLYLMSLVNGPDRFTQKLLLNR